MSSDLLHGIKICRCGRVYSRCDCPEHQDMVVIVSDKCPECEGEDQPDMYRVESSDPDPEQDLESIWNDWNPSSQVSGLLQDLMHETFPELVGPLHPRDFPSLMMCAELMTFKALRSAHLETLQSLKQLRHIVEDKK